MPTSSASNYACIIVTCIVIIAIHYLFWLGNRILFSDTQLDAALRDVRQNHHTGDLILFSGVGVDAYFGKLASQTEYSRAAMLVLPPDTNEVYALIMHVNHYNHTDIYNRKTGIQLLRLRDIINDGYNYIDIYHVAEDARISADDIANYYRDIANVEYDRWYYIHYIPGDKLPQIHQSLVWLAGNRDKKYCLEVPVDVWERGGVFAKYDLAVPGKPMRKKILYDDLLELPFVQKISTRLYPTSANRSLYNYFWWKL